MTTRDLADAAAMLRRVLDAVDRGELDASGSAAASLVRHLEGAAAVLEIASGASPRPWG
ncbi:MAG: hypothetical protein ACYDAD_09630 [Acidimicrobiales bacterium]